LEGAWAACYFPCVSSRTALLAGLALAVLAAGVYLFIQVRASPAEAQVPPPSHARAHPPVHEEPDVTPPTASDDTTAQVGKPLDRPVGVGAIRGHGDTGPVIPATDDHPAISDIPDKADPRFQMVLGEANKAYDRQDFDEARTIATKVLAKDPTNTRMLRIMVSSHCIEGDQAAAQSYWDKLPEFDRQQMTKRCATYGVSFNPPAQ
jgi:hypothetical protein